MKVKEMAELLGGEQTLVLIDKNTCNEVYSEKDDACSVWKKYSDYEVVEFRSHSNTVVAFYISASERYSTWLDITYSIKVDADVPYDIDYNDYLKDIAEDMLRVMPKTISVGNYGEAHQEYNNLESGSFYDMIENA